MRFQGTINQGIGAKILLMQNLRMTESQAHHYLEKQAMNLRKSKYDVALRVLKTYEN